MRLSLASALAASLNAACLCVPALLGAPAFAADLPVAPAYVPPPMFTVIIGVGPEVTTDFPGSKSYMVLPSIHVAYLKPGEHDRFYTPDDAADIAVVDTGFFRAGPAANYLSRRGLSGGNGQFNGLPNVGASFEAGGFAEIYPLQDHLRLRGEILKAVTGYDGLVGNVGADVIGRVGPFQLSAGPRVKFGDQRYADRYFTITPVAAAINGLVTPYQASSGLTSVGAFATARYDFTPTVAAVFFGGYDRLSGSVGSSPVATVLGTRDQFTGGVQLSYAFGFKGFGILGY